MSQAWRKIGIAIVAVILAPVTSFGCSVVVVRTPQVVSRDVTISLTHADAPVRDIELSVIESGTKKTIRHLTTDAQGRAEIRDLPAGEYSIRSEISDDEITGTGKPGSTTLHLSAVVGRNPIILSAIDATVFDPSGAVIPGSILVVEGLDDSHTPIAVAVSDASGHVALNVKPGMYVMRVASPGFQTAVIPILIDKSGWPDFRLTLHLGGCPPSGPNYTGFNIEAGR